MCGNVVHSQDTITEYKEGFTMRVISIIGGLTVVMLSILFMVMAADALEYEMTGSCKGCLVLDKYFSGRDGQR